MKTLLESIVPAQMLGIEVAGRRALTLALNDAVIGESSTTEGEPT